MPEIVPNWPKLSKTAKNGQNLMLGHFWPFFQPDQFHWQFFCDAAIADSGLILFAAVRLKNLRGQHGSEISNVRPEVPEKNNENFIY